MWTRFWTSCSACRPEVNWRYLATEALLPVSWALGLTLLGGAAWAIRLHLGGGSSRVALGRLMKALVLLFPLTFLVACAWAGRQSLRGLLGVALHHPVDQRAMGLLRLHGEGFLKADPAVAAGWFQRAAHQGDGPSQLYLARALASGRGLPPNPTAALQWAEAAAAQGLPEAMVLCGDLLRSKDPAHAIRWYGQAIGALQAGLRQREPRACLLYGTLCATGRGLPRDPLEGVAWMKVAEARGLPSLQTLPIRLSEAKLTPEQREEAARRSQTLLSRP